MRIPASLPVPGVLTAFLLAAAQGPGPAPAGAAVPGRRRHGSTPPRHMQITCKSYANHTPATRRCVTGGPRYANETRGRLSDWSHPGAQQPMMRRGGWSRESWAGVVVGRKRKWRAFGGAAAAAAPRMLRLRCKARSGTHPLPGLTAHSRLRDMQAALAALTGVPIPAQRLLLGFPPRSLDLSDGERRLGDLGIHSGESRGLRGAGGRAPAFCSLRCPAGC